MMDGEEAGCSFREGVHDEPYEKVTAEQKPDGDRALAMQKSGEREGTAGRRNSTCKGPEVRVSLRCS